MWVSTFLKRELIDEVKSMIRDFLKDCDINPKVMDIPLQVNLQLLHYLYCPTV